MHEIHEKEIVYSELSVLGSSIQLENYDVTDLVQVSAGSIVSLFVYITFEVIFSCCQNINRLLIIQTGAVVLMIKPLGFQPLSYRSMFRNAYLSLSNKLTEELLIQWLCITYYYYYFCTISQSFSLKTKTTIQLFLVFYAAYFFQ